MNRFGHQLTLDPLHYGAISSVWMAGQATFDEARASVFWHLIQRGWLPRRLTVTDGRIGADFGYYSKALAEAQRAWEARVA